MLAGAGPTLTTRFETAAQNATARVPVASVDMTAAQVRRALVGKEYEAAGHVVALEDGAFAGIMRIEALFAAPDEALVRDLMDPQAPVVAPGVDQEVAAWTAVRRGEAALAVVTSDGEFVGVIAPHRLLGILLAEHDEDLARLGGFLQGTAEAREASLEPVRRRYRHRLPWLLVGLAGSLVAAALVGRFESRLEEVVMLAFFIPAIVYLADAVGTQTETVVVRALSVGVKLRNIVGRETLAGLAIGATLAAVGGPLVWWWWGDATIALTVGLTVFAASATATVAAMLLPWMLSAAGRDPAFGSGPLATVIQDLLSILIYFAIASALLR